MSRDIRFIDSQYHDLFRIPDGGMIQVDYPDRSFAARCEYVDDYHLRVGNELFHICQFAEILERGGGSCRPEPEIDSEGAAWDMGHRGFLAVQKCASGWDYTLYDKDMHELDGGQLDHPQLSIQKARNEIAEDFGWGRRTMTQLDFESFQNQVMEHETDEISHCRDSALQKLQDLKETSVPVPARTAKKEISER